MIYRARLYWLINCLNGREWLWPGVMGQLATLVYGPWPTSELSRPGKPACFRRWQVSLSVCVSLSVSLSLYIYILYIYILYAYIYILYILYAYINIYIVCRT